MSEITADEKTLDRIRKLLAQAEGTDNEHEADTFMSAATKLMARYGIERAMLADAGKVSDKITTWEILLGNPYEADKRSLIAVIASAKGCKTLYWKLSSGSRFQVVGHASDIEQVNMLYTSLLLQMISGVRRVPGGISARKSWMMGFTNRISQRLRASQRTAEAEAPTSAAGRSVELVLLDRTAAVSQEFNRLHPNVRTTAPRKLSSRSAYEAGRQAGDRADIGGGTNGVNGKAAKALGSWPSVGDMVWFSNADDSGYAVVSNVTREDDTTLLQLVGFDYEAMEVTELSATIHDVKPLPETVGTEERARLAIIQKHVLATAPASR